MREIYGHRGHGWFLLGLLMIAIAAITLYNISAGGVARAALTILGGPTPSPDSPPPLVTVEPAFPVVPTSERASLPIWASPTPLPSLSASTPGQFNVQNMILGSITPLRTDLVNCFGHIEWSPDGQLLAFSMATGGEKQGAAWPRTDIAMVDASGQKVQRVTPGFNPVWSPSGNFIAYLDYSDNLDDLYVRIVDLHTRHSILVTTIKRGGVFPILAWLSDTELLYYLNGLVSYNYQTAQRSNWLEETISSHSVSRASPFQMIATLPQQGLIAVASKHALVVLERDVQGIRILKQQEEGVDNPAMAFSPDGEALAYVSAFTQQVKIVPARHNDPGVELPWAIRGTAWSISWSPDGASLVYVDADGMHIVNRNGSGLQRIEAAPEGILDVAWSPRGSPLILSQDTGALLSLPVSVR